MPKFFLHVHACLMLFLFLFRDGDGWREGKMFVGGKLGIRFTQPSVVLFHHSSQATEHKTT